MMGASVRDFAREVEMIERHNAGQSLRQIANNFGISHERVRQILQRAGADMRGSGRRKGRPKVPAIAKAPKAAPQLASKPWPKRRGLIAYAGKE